jgi:putative transposase
MPVEGKYPAIARDSEYVRHGTLSLFVCINLVSGKIIHKVLERSRSREFIEFLGKIELINPVKEITMTLEIIKHIHQRKQEVISIQQRENSNLCLLQNMHHG